MSETWLFMGNPGTGKSTLLNCHLRSPVFRSGLSFGGGLTKIAQMATGKGGIVYMDTPGLADGKAGAERAAAEAITNALRFGGWFKLCFIVRLESGRVVSEDLVTMERVLDSINLPNVPFSVIINDVSASMFKTLAKGEYEFERVVTLLNSGKYSTPYFIFIPRFRKLVEADNRIVKLPRDIRDRIAQFPNVNIPPNAVAEIWTQGFTASVSTVDDKVKTLQKNESAMKIVQVNLEKKHPNFWKTAFAALMLVGRIALVAAIFL